jgi:ABC-type antimicrobial peptide transport system permease subunit
VPVKELVPQITAAARSLDRDIAVDIGTMAQRARGNTAAKRMVVTVMSVFGFVALLLAALGTYGLLSYAVAQRGRELAIRSALGATRKQLVSMVFGGVGRIVLAGLAGGILIASALTRLIESQLVDVTPTDVTALGASIAAIVATAVVATWIPARRAGRADPSEALRGE